MKLPANTAAAFYRGMREFRLSITTRCATTELRNAYDWGREWAHRATFRTRKAAEEFTRGRFGRRQLIIVSRWKA